MASFRVTMTAARQPVGADADTAPPTKPSAAPRTGGTAPAKRPAPSSAGPAASGEAHVVAASVASERVRFRQAMGLHLPNVWNNSMFKLPT